MTEVGTAIPENVNLAKVKPVAVNSYARRIKSYATNAQTFGEQQYIKIQLETSTPGAFYDPLQSYIKMDVSIFNTNPYIDFFSWGTAGAAALWEEWRIFQQGTPVEEILQYNVLHQLMMDLNGVCKKPYPMFRSCEYKQPIDEKFHLNAIKPPMVSQSGNPMYYQALLRNVVNQSCTWGIANSTGTFAGLAGKPYLLSSSSPGVSFHRFIVQIGQQGSPTVSLNTVASQRTVVPFDLPALLLGRQSAGAPGSGPGAFYGGPSGATTAPSGNQGTGNNSNALPNVSIAVQTPTNGNTVAPGVNAITAAFNPINQWVDVTDGMIGPPFTSGLLAPASNSGVPPALSLFGSTVAFYGKGPDYDQYNPLNWPWNMPNDRALRRDAQPIENMSDYFMFLSNVKYIPVGLPGQPRPTAGNPTAYGAPSTAASSINFTNTTAYSPPSGFTTTTTKFTVCIPPISGILGSMAQKAFPAMLCAPGSTYIEIKTAQAVKAFQVSMDPCRRVLGTNRDFVPFGGSIGGVFGQFNYVSADDISQTVATDWSNSITGLSTAISQNLCSLQYLGTPTSGTVPTVTSPPTLAQTPWTSNYLFGIGSGQVINADPAVYNPTSTPIAQGIVSQLNVTKRPAPLGCFACIGANLAPINNYLNSASYSGYTANWNLMFSPFSVAAMEGVWTTYEMTDARFTTILWEHDNNNRNTIYYGSVSILDQPTVGSQNVQGNNSMAATLSNTGPSSSSGYLNTSLVALSGTPVGIFNNDTTIGTRYNTANNGSGVLDQYSAMVSVSNNAANTVTTTTSFGGFAQWATATKSNSGRYTFHAQQGVGSGGLNNFLPSYNMEMQNIGFCGHPAGVPLPQYMLVTYPWLKKSLYVSTNNGTLVNPVAQYQIFGDNVGVGDLCSETTACYGTYLPKVCAQALRCFNAGNTNYLQYQISNVEFVTEQVLIPQGATEAILSLAARGDISISTTGVRMYASPVNSSISQNIIIPAKIGNANAWYGVLQPQNYISGTEAQLYDGCSRFCPFTQVYSADTVNCQTSASTIPSITSLASFISSNSAKYAVGQSTPLVTVNVPAVTGAFQMQLICGNELIPQQPLQSPVEIISELAKCQHRLYDTDSTYNIDFALCPSSGYPGNTAVPIATFSPGSTANLYYDALLDNGFCTAFTFAPFLDDQTYIVNPSWNYIGAAMWNSTVASSQGYPGLSNTSYKSTNSLYGARGEYTLPFFQPLASNWVFAIDLDTWPGYSDVVRSGKFLGNVVTTLRLENAIALAITAANQYTGLNGLQLLSYIPHDLRLSWQAGGSLVSYY